MRHTHLRRSLTSALTLLLIAACAAPSDSTAVEHQDLQSAELEGPLGELVGDLMYGATDERARAAGDLASLGSDAAPAAEHLMVALDDEEPTVRALAADALGVVGGELSATLESLNECLHRDEVEGVQTAAAGALVRLSPASAELLVEGLRSNRASVRWQCARGVGRLGRHAGDTREVLVATLDDEDAQVRACAAKAIGQTNRDAPEVVQPLIRSLSDESAEVRSNAAWALGRCGELAKRAILPLINALRDESADVRVQAARAIGELGPDAAQAVMDLTSALDDQDPEVVEEVTAALEAIQHD